MALAIRPMLSVAREEAAILTSELASTARAGVLEAGIVGERKYCI